jgi:Response regulator receiver domain
VISVTPQTDVPPKPVKVLFADDEDLVRLMMADVLREKGFQVIEASDAAEAISIIKTTPVDAVITDLRMSAVADGLELAAYPCVPYWDCSCGRYGFGAPPLLPDLVRAPGRQPCTAEARAACVSCAVPSTPSSCE